MLCYVDGMKKGVDSKGEVMHKNATSKLHSRCVYPYPLLPLPLLTSVTPRLLLSSSHCASQCEMSGERKILTSAILVISVIVIIIRNNAIHGFSEHQHPYYER